MQCESFLQNKMCSKVAQKFSKFTSTFFMVWILFLLEEPSGDYIPSHCRLRQLDGQSRKLGLDKFLIQVVQHAKPILHPSDYVTGFIIVFLSIAFIEKGETSSHNLTKTTPSKPYH
jgi:hypothetical protein